MGGVFDPSVIVLIGNFGLAVVQSWSIVLRPTRILGFKDVRTHILLANMMLRVDHAFSLFSRPSYIPISQLLVLLYNINTLFTTWKRGLQVFGAPELTWCYPRAVNPPKGEKDCNRPEAASQVCFVRRVLQAKGVKQTIDYFQNMKSDGHTG